MLQSVVLRPFHGAIAPSPTVFIGLLSTDYPWAKDGSADRFGGENRMNEDNDNNASYKELRGQGPEQESRMQQ